MAQIFYNWSAKQKQQIVSYYYLKKLQVHPSQFRKIIGKIDHYDVLVTNFNYLLRLNKCAWKDYLSSINSIRICLVMIFYNSLNSSDQAICSTLHNKIVNDKNTFLKNADQPVIPDLLTMIFKKSLVLKNASNKWLLEADVWLRKIALIFYKTFQKYDQSAYYYLYGYYFALLLVLNIQKHVFLKSPTKDLFHIKMTLIDEYINAISRINRWQFNNFIVQNNFYFQKMASRSRRRVHIDKFVRMFK